MNSPNSKPVPQTRVLLIDDDSVDRASVRRALGKSGSGYEIVEAPDGATGLALARAQHHDCVLLDYRLPDMDAFELLAALISPEGGSHAVLMLTGEADQELALRLMRAGALDYLAKSEVTPTSLGRAIRYAKARSEFVRELGAARRNAERQSTELETINRQKNVLFSIIAHDLRNPFQAILGLATTMKRAVAAKDLEQTARRAEGIEEASNRAYALMESLFAWASLQMDATEVAFSDVDVAALFEEAIAQAAQAAATKDVTLQGDAQGLHVVAQRDMLAAVVRNLVSNAVKFTLPGGVISLMAVRTGDAVALSVSDTGVGIPAERVSDLLRLDRRSSTDGTAGERGSGLGLHLCGDLLQRQGSKLHIASELGKGTTLSFVMSAATGVQGSLRRA